MNKKDEKKDKKIEKKVEVKKVSSFKKKKKIKKNITNGIAYVYSTFNNTIISIVYAWHFKCRMKDCKIKHLEPRA